MRRFRWLAALLLALILIAAGCGGDDSGGSSERSDRSDDETTETTEAEPEGQVLVEDSFDDDSNLWGADGFNDDLITGAIDGGTLTFSVSGDLIATPTRGRG